MTSEEWIHFKFLFRAGVKLQYKYKNSDGWQNFGNMKRPPFEQWTDYEQWDFRVHPDETTT